MTPMAPMARSEADTVLISEYREADSLVRRYRINTTGEDEVVLHYRINLSALNKTYMENSEELNRLDRFMQELKNEPPYRLKRVVVQGFASPDGPLALNERLAKARMNDLLAYLNKHYSLAEHTTIESSWEVLPWRAVMPWVEQSSLKERERVVALVEGGLSPAMKQQELKRMPAVWSYLKGEVLPALRYAEVMLVCEEVSYIEQRTYIAPPKPAPKPVAQKPRCTDPCGECLVVDEGITGLIVEVEP